MVLVVYNRGDIPEESSERCFEKKERGKCDRNTWAEKDRGGLGFGGATFVYVAPLFALLSVEETFLLVFCAY